MVTQKTQRAAKNAKGAVGFLQVQDDAAYFKARRGEIHQQAQMHGSGTQVVQALRALLSVCTVFNSTRMACSTSRSMKYSPTAIPS